MIHQYLLRLLAAATALVLALAVTGCTPTGEALENESAGKSGEAEREDETEKEADERVPVEVVALDRGPIEAVLRFSTNLEAERAVGVFSEASRQVVDLLVEEGDYVTKGQLLLRLEDEAQKSALAKAQSQLRKAQREYQRQKGLYDDELISEQAYSEATYEVEQLEIAVEDARRELSYTELKAPIAGTVTQRLVNLGDTITMNQHLFDLVDFDSIVARVFVPEKDMSRVRTNQAARIFAEPLGDAQRIGRVERIAPVVDAQSGTVKTTVAIPKNQGLRPGMFVEVVLVTAVHKQALLVPKRAIVYDNDQAFVFRAVDGEDEDGESVTLAERLLIQPLLEDRRFVEPVAGSALSAGDRIVIAGQAGLKDGAQVRLLGQAEDTEGQAAEEVAEDEGGDREAA